jgi:hypothetical protein
MPTPPARSGPPAEPRRRLLFWGTIALVWTALALVVSLQTAVWLRTQGQPVPWGKLVPDRLADWYTCAVFTPVFFWLARRFPLDRHRWVRHLPIHLAVAACCVPLKYALYLPLHDALGFPHRPYVAVLETNFAIESIAFWAVIVAVHAIEYHRRWRERDAAAARLEAQLTQARLDALAAQLQPHFLFNTLQGVSTLMHRDVVAADEMLARLSSLLRATLRREPHEVPLLEELALLEHYVGIVRARFGDRLRVEYEIAPEAARALVPRFSLQPLVENALQHGIARRAGAGRVTIAALRENGALALSVTDDGAGLDGNGDFPADGIGLGNTRARLAELYGDAQALALEPIAGGGLRVRLRLPWRGAEPA